MKGKKNDFSMTFFLYKERVLHIPYVHITEVAEKWMDAKNKKWGHANIYNRRTGEFLKRIYHKDILDVREYLRKVNREEKKSLP